MMRWTRQRSTLLGRKLVITDRVKPGKLYKFEDYVLVNEVDEPGLMAWILSTAGHQPKGAFE